MCSLDWSVVFAYNCQKPAHISVLDYTAYNTLAKMCAKRLDGRKIPVCLDSSVTVGSPAHGRSSSRAFARTQQQVLPYAIGGGLYFAGLQTPTKIHRADDPTRFRRARAPDFPAQAWLEQLQQGDFRGLDCAGMPRGYRSPAMTRA